MESCARLSPPPQTPATLFDPSVLPFRNMGVTTQVKKNIWVAASDGDIERVRELIDRGGVDVNARDEFGYSALHAAVSYGHRDLAELLLRHGADVDIRDFDGDTPLFVCETRACAEILVAHGAVPGLENEEGRTAVDVAEEEGGTEVAEYLHELLARADANSHRTRASSEASLSAPRGSAASAARDFGSRDSEGETENADNMDHVVCGDEEDKESEEAEEEDGEDDEEEEGTVEDQDYEEPAD
ncbi:MAG: ankyrin repeat-containing domain protein, partial [Olpidium bornovanus]